MVERATPQVFFGGEVSWDDLLKAILLIGFLVICFVVLTRRRD